MAQTAKNIGAIVVDDDLQDRVELYVKGKSGKYTIVGVRKK